MPRLAILLGYAGVLPFLFFMGHMYYVYGHPAYVQTAVIFQLAYAGMIASFLGGIHWAQAMRTSHRGQLIFSVIPALFSIVMLGLALYGKLWFTSLFLMAIMYYVVLIADKKWIFADEFPPAYMRFRRNLTAIVSFLLIFSALMAL